MSETEAKGAGRAVHEITLPTFHVVVNPEEQYSIWDDRREIPAGWTATGFHGSEADCLHHIGTVWTDMRPRSLRTTEAADV